MKCHTYDLCNSKLNIQVQTLVSVLSLSIDFPGLKTIFQLYSDFATRSSTHSVSCYCSKIIKEAVKLFGLVLMHYGLLNSLTGAPCRVAVASSTQSLDKDAWQKYNSWRARSRIYVECTTPKPRVSINILFSWLPNNMFNNILNLRSNISVPFTSQSLCN